MTDFWSKRRAGVQAEIEAESVAEREQALAQETAEKTDEELLHDLGLPDPDDMVQGDDFGAFMKDAVPARLKTRALRKLWRLNPVLANVDGLVDYGEDFTDAATVVENLQTTYQVGKGMLAHVQEMARQAAAAAEGADETPASDDMDEVLPEPAADDDQEDVLMAHAADASPPEPAEAVAADPQEPEMPHPSRHRMRFHFEDQPTG